MKRFIFMISISSFLSNLALSNDNEPAIKNHASGKAFSCFMDISSHKTDLEDIEIHAFNGFDEKVLEGMEQNSDDDVFIQLNLDKILENLERVSGEQEEYTIPFEGIIEEDENGVYFFANML